MFIFIIVHHYLLRAKGIKPELFEEKIVATAILLVVILFNTDYRWKVIRVETGDGNGIMSIRLEIILDVVNKRSAVVDDPIASKLNNHIG